MDQLFNLFPRVSLQGFIIFDDYQSVPDCRRAVNDFFDWHGLKKDFVVIDRCGAYWRKDADPPLKMELYHKFLR